MYIKLNKKIGKPMYIQLYDAICADIFSGRLPNGMKLPSRRVLASELKIAQNTVDSAYKMLTDTGYATSVMRQGYFVSFKNTQYQNDIPWEIIAPEDVVFSPNGIDTSKIGRSVYAKIFRDIAYNDGIDIFSYVEKGGEFELRSAISKYLYSFRNVKCSPNNIIIGASTEYLLISLAAILPENTSFIFENPCDTHFCRALEDYKNRIFLLPFSGEKFDIDALYSCGGNILFIDSCSRFPLGLSLNDNERGEILEWVNQDENRYIIENCYDAEIQWEHHKSLYSEDVNNKVIYLGSFSRSFCPAVKTSYMVLPPELLSRWKNNHVYYYALTSKTEQFALSEFINKGHFTKHYKAMRRNYREKQKYLTERIRDTFGDEIKIYSYGSTYLTAEHTSMTTDEIKLRARHNGVKLFSLNSFNANKNPRSLKHDRLVIGFGDLSCEKIALGVRLWKNSMS